MVFFFFSFPDKCEPEDEEKKNSSHNRCLARSLVGFELKLLITVSMTVRSEQFFFFLFSSDFPQSNATQYMCLMLSLETSYCHISYDSCWSVPLRPHPAVNRANNLTLFVSPTDSISILIK